MKFVLYADIHAQIPQMEAVLEAVDKENADKEILIGDLIMLGPQPAEVVDHFMNVRQNVDILIGNLDMWVVDKFW
ncbi:MAG: YfcE family phosphodiesterase, partial [Rhodospirillaceae bacterium]|nr:YfcE family phosphodiesterase [Rhodospirillaceae bacterium]